MCSDCRVIDATDCTFQTDYVHNGAYPFKCDPNYSGESTSYIMSPRMAFLGYLCLTGNQYYSIIPWKRWLVFLERWLPWIEFIWNLISLFDFHVMLVLPEFLAYSLFYYLIIWRLLILKSFESFFIWFLQIIIFSYIFVQFF